MAIVRWEPFGELMSLRQAMDQLVGERFVRPSHLFEVMGWEVQPLIDVYQTPTEVVVKASLPGVEPEGVEISIVENTLTIKGESKGGEEVKDEDYLYKEIHSTSFIRSIALPGAVDPNKAEAASENGVLTITIPKAEEAKPKKVEVKAKKAIEGEKKEKK